MTDIRSGFGVSATSLWVPTLRVRLEDWCAWTGNDWDKVRAVVGRSFRVVAPYENVYTMAASAVLRLVVTNDVDPQRIGYLALGTESSTDNSAGAVIVRGLVDDALRALGRPPLSRACEVPEIKHACLGGVYALKGAVRWLATEGRGRQAIVVSADIAEYERGSSGEQTQGAGAVAQLVEADPKLFSVDLGRTGSASSYRGPDFRKPTRRHAMAGYTRDVHKCHDFPVFNGKYSTTCYVDETAHAMTDLLLKVAVDAPTFYEGIEAALFHRPYHHMPQAGMAALWVLGLAGSPSRRADLEALCTSAGVDAGAVVAEANAHPDLFAQALEGRHDAESHPETMKVVKAFRATPKHAEVTGKLGLGADLMKDLGNVYTAALPAWMAAAFEHALEQGRDLAGRDVLCVGYGSGDAAEAFVIVPRPGWEDAARRIGFREALEGPTDLTREQYEAVHDGRAAPGLGDLRRDGFSIERVGERQGRDFTDIGIEYYRYVPGHHTGPRGSDARWPT